MHALLDLRREGGYEQKDLLPLVKDWRISTEVHGFARFWVAKKLHFIKIRIKERKSMVGRVDQVRTSAMKELEKWELVEEKMVARDAAISIVEPQLGTVKISWRQKSSALWLENGSIKLARFAPICARLVIQRHLRRRLLVISRIYILVVVSHTCFREYYFSFYF